jgi:exopolysaccharide production protein ExoQ
MIISNKFWLDRRLVEKWEKVITIFWLLYFMGVEFPPPISPSLLNALSYPFIAILVALHWKQVFWFATRDISLLFLIGTALISVFWSVDTGLTLNWSRGLLRILLFGAYLAACYSIKDQLKMLAWAFSIGAISSLIVAFAIPSYGINITDRGGLVGIFPYKNYLGYSMVLGAITFSLLFFKERKPSSLFWSGFCTAIVLSTRSSASLVCLIFLLSLMPLYQLSKLKYRQRVILICLVLILVGTIVTIVLNNLETILVDILGESAEFSGRTPIWTLTIEKVIEERPWFGYGVNAFWKSNAGSFVISNTWASQEALLNQNFNFHSAYVPVFAGLGFLGLLMYAINAITVFIRVLILLVSTKKIEFFWCFLFLMFVFLGGLADDMVSILGSSSYCAVYIAISLSTIIEYRKLRYTQKNLVNA